MISVCMGVYNCKNKELLEKSIDLVINQTCEDWEPLVCNDGSTDDMLQVLEEMKLKDPRIRVLSYSENHGLYALNTCIKNARGYSKAG